MWDQWNTWESCTVSCGGGTRVRRRSKLVEAAHGGADCVGDTHETQPCGNQCCPVDCKLVEIYYLCFLTIKLNEFEFVINSLIFIIKLKKNNCSLV